MVPEQCLRANQLKAEHVTEAFALVKWNVIVLLPTDQGTIMFRLFFFATNIYLVIFVYDFKILLLLLFLFPFP